MKFKNKILPSIFWYRSITFWILQSPVCQTCRCPSSRSCSCRRLCWSLGLASLSNHKYFIISTVVLNMQAGVWVSDHLRLPFISKPDCEMAKNWFTRFYLNCIVMTFFFRNNPEVYSMGHSFKISKRNKGRIRYRWIDLLNDLWLFRFNIYTRFSVYNLLYVSK